MRRVQARFARGAARTGAAAPASIALSARAARRSGGSQRFAVSALARITGAWIATQRFERGLILASLKQREAKMQVQVGKGRIDCANSLEFFSGVSEALLAKCSERTIVVFAGSLHRRASSGGRNQEKCR